MTPLLFLILLFATVPIALVLSLTALWYIYDSGNTVLYDSVSQQMFSGVDNYWLLAIPLFIMTGELMNEGGMTQRLVHVARVCVGGVRGELPILQPLDNMFQQSIHI